MPCLRRARRSDSDRITFKIVLGSYKPLRDRLLRHEIWSLIAFLVARAFDTDSGEIVNVSLLVTTHDRPKADHSLVGVDAASEKTPLSKDSFVRENILIVVRQGQLLENPDARVSLENAHGVSPLSNYAISMLGILSGDRDYWVRCFWELPELEPDRRALQGTVDSVASYARREQVINWATSGVGMLRRGTDNETYARDQVLRFHKWVRRP
jgi:hypothetical protein